MEYESFSLSNGLKIIYLPSQSAVAYCGFAVNAGTRDEKTPSEFGLAHFVEHTLFKGTEKRKSWHIINRMENVGGELNAYTTKEETFLYAVALNEDTERAIELLSDLIFNSQFPQVEVDKEREVIIDEINSYKDNPSELIYDEFENILFANNEIGHNILGEEESLNKINSTECLKFVNEFYRPDNMVFFFHGKTPLNKIIRLANKYFSNKTSTCNSYRQRVTPEINKAENKLVNNNLYQSHVMIGGRGYDFYDKKRLGLYLLNNILGGPGMNSRLNIQLREKNGLVYTVESSITSYSDSGVFSIYFGSDHNNVDRCLSLIHKELKRLRDTKLTSSQFNAALKQLKGQLGISRDNKENLALNMGKSFLHFNKYDSLSETYRKLDLLNADLLFDIANEIFDEENLTQLIMK
ncbi:putative Zn-dependent peptidase [Dysgonomonadaceae bacterium PH5-43]|nr:putative Zn-dependent peptidase [Dysgonomonadaceae bacterium PH5-43]